MAEYCKECATKYLGIPEKKLSKAIFSDDLDLCEGCGQMKPVLITLKPTLATRWDNLGYKLRKKFNK